MNDGRRTLILTHHVNQGCRSSIKQTLSEFLYPAVIAFAIVALVVPALVYFMIYNLGTDPIEEAATCVISQDYRVPCGYMHGSHIGNISSRSCLSINCCYDDHTKQCYHFLPSKYGFKQQKPFIYTRKLEETPLGNQMHGNLSVLVTDKSDYLKIELVSQNDKKRIKYRGTYGNVSYKLYEDTLALDVYRHNESEPNILQTARGPLIASDGYWEWTMQLTQENDTLYGLGGLIINGNVSKVIYKNEADHTTLPFFLAQHEDQFHAVMVEHVGVLEVQILESQLIVLRAINTEGLSLRLFPGPTLDDIYQQKLQTVNVVDNVNETPRWMLGTHICRNAILDTEKAIKAWDDEQDNSKNILRPDTDCFNEMFMIMMIEDQSDVKLMEGLKRIIGQIKAQGKKFMLPITPHIPMGDFELYNLAVELDVLLKNGTNAYEALYKKRRVAILDYSSKNIVKYLTSLFKTLLDHILPSSTSFDDIDGIYLLDNWPQDDNYNFNATQEKLLYFNEDITTALNQTLPLTIMKQDKSVQQQEQYVRQQIELIQKVTAKSIISSSYFFKMQSPLLPQYVNMTWTNLKATTTKILFNNFFTHPLSLSPVCGSMQIINANTNDNELCARWFLNSATQPGQRLTSNWLIHKNFTGSARTSAAKALNTKRMLSYYQYDVFKNSGYASKPMFMDFFSDNNTWALDEQYILGDLLVAQVVLPRAEVARVYLPVKFNWYEFWGGQHYGSGWVDLSIAKDERILFVKAGSVVPLIQEVMLESELTQRFTILIANYCNQGYKRKVTREEVIKGSLLFDNEKLEIEVMTEGLKLSNILKVKTEIGCDGPLPLAHPSQIAKLQLYDCTRNAPSYYQPAFDLCTQTDDTTIIPYQHL